MCKNAQGIASVYCGMTRWRVCAHSKRHLTGILRVKRDGAIFRRIPVHTDFAVAKLLAENEQLHKEKEHLKQTYKDLFDSIKRTRVQTKDQNESLMAQLNKKSNENADVLAQIQKEKRGFRNLQH
ncbi:hypothetical protein Tco_0441142 [Tanacetum coccineum]